ncbi:hypothetical protein, conserved [Babesia bigemina]|uniref:At4g15545-like C-terminal domain-containing protein n=1 Tax=Babesia bigemina TaxID=5866 RepID=A0A061DDK8_BABBI|nr:hypothetical protein, conserved [Babesia bigemina]CDR96335.1 hypothetical protein, conserved [Babesia bigemina]|eukprot:XP_012768521.1 hypothetical protein, conserved [Babesia bigemina]
MDMSSLDLTWLPSDADEQLALGFRIISNAYKTRVTSLEAEIRTVRAAVAEKSEHLAAFQKKYSSLEVQLIECTQRGNQLAEENRNLVAQIKKLQRDINRLETLKRAVLHSIQEDGTDVEADHRYYNADDLLHSAAPRTMIELSGADTVESAFIKRFGGKPGFSGTTSTTPTTNMNYEKGTVDGRNFLNVARATLNPDDMNGILSIIKKFNGQQLSKENALASARQLLGENNAKLYEEFKQLFCV